MHVYRRPHDYAQQAAIVRWHTTRTQEFSWSTARLELTTYPWTIGLSPTIGMTVAELTLATYPWTIVRPWTATYGPAALRIVTPPWTVVGTIVSTVPDVLTDPYQDAIQTVWSAGYKTTLTYATSGTAPAGTVTAQSPTGGTPAAPGTDVTLTVEFGEFVWPASVVANVSDWRLVPNTVTRVSPLTGKTRTESYGGDHWACTLTCHNLTGAGAAELRAFLSRLRGRAYRALVADHGYAQRGTLTALTVNGAGQTGTPLVCNGATPTTGTLLAGDMISVDDRLYMVTADATAVAGAVTLSVVPPLDGPPTNGATVKLGAAVVGRFVLAGNTVGWTHTPGGITSFEVIELEEDRT